MIRNIAWVMCAMLLMSCTSKKVVSQTQDSILDVSDREQVDTDNKLPFVTFEQDTIHLGNMVAGEVKSMAFKFQNTGVGDLDIELVTACKCTALDWPQEIIRPGQGGEITVEFDSKGFEGEVIKTVDIIANTDPIIVEAVFTATVLPN